MIYIFCFVLGWFSPNSGLSDGTETNTSQLISTDIEYLEAFYKNCHQHPEVSLYEKETSERLANEMEKIGFEVTKNFGGYGLVAILDNGDGPMILYRTDMDALPMIEKTELPYQSLTIGDESITQAMHSCGHDMHMTSWLGTARLMAKTKKDWKGKLMFIAQPAEEIGQGAKLMLNNGLYESFGVPDYGMALHCNPQIEVGKAAFDDGFTMAHVQSVDIIVKGVGAHGASPHLSVDPVVIASLIVMELQTIVSRSISPIEDAVITVGSIHGGTKHNIISDEVKLQLTIRTYKDEVRALIRKRIEAICKGVAISAGLPEDKYPIVDYFTHSTSANYNDPKLVTQMKKSAAKAIGSQNIVVAGPLMVGEDFSEYRHPEHQIPTVLYWLGTVTKEKIDSGDLPGLHSPYYFPDIRQSLTTALTLNHQILMDLLSAKN